MSSPQKTPADLVGPPSPFDAPIKTVQETATVFSKDAVKWAEKSTVEAAMAVGIALVGVIGFHLLRYLLLRLLRVGPNVHPRRLRSIVYRFVRQTSVVFLTVLGCFIATYFIDVPKGVMRGLEFALMITGVLQLALWIRELVRLLVEGRLARQGGDETALSSAVGVLNWLINLGIWSVALLLILDNLGVNVTGLLAGLGIGGLAIGLAAQGIMSDLFSALSIVFDKPFVKGDFIRFADKSGEVEKIGLKTTRIKSLSGEQIVVANNQLLGSVIHNHRRMDERRVAFQVGILYETAPDMVETVPQILREAIEADSNCRFDRAHFINFGPSSLDFEAVYYFKGRDYIPFRDAHQAILLRIFRRFGAEGIGFAYPTQTLHLVRDDKAV